MKGDTRTMAHLKQSPCQERHLVHSSMHILPAHIRAEVDRLKSASLGALMAHDP